MCLLAASLLLQAAQQAVQQRPRAALESNRPRSRPAQRMRPSAEVSRCPHAGKSWGMLSLQQLLRATCSPAGLGTELVHVHADCFTSLHGRSDI
jgi:hypothetical protein